jgi:hypothetical protein
MHCIDSSEWKLVDYMHNVVLAIIKHVIQKATCISLSCDYIYDEVITLYNNVFGY